MSIRQQGNWLELVKAFFEYSLLWLKLWFWKVFKPKHSSYEWELNSISLEEELCLYIYIYKYVIKKSWKINVYYLYLVHIHYALRWRAIYKVKHSYIKSQIFYQWIMAWEILKICIWYCWVIKLLGPKKKS